AAVQDGFERVQEAPQRTRIEFALRVAEAAPFRLPTSAVEQILDLVPATDPGVGALHGLARATIAGAHAAGRSRGAEGLRSAAAALAEPGVGQHRAESVVLSGWFRARMLTLEGDRAGAAEAARTGWESATRLGHVWLQAAFLQLLAGLEPDGDHARRLRVLVEGIEKDLPSAEDRSRLAATWAP
ncbi:MAG: hypothetical protein O7E54_12650, partial [Planctomycetota bacterium]|nr:hypothetical protein [Planctomycetota bacterium]